MKQWVVLLGADDKDLLTIGISNSKRLELALLVKGAVVGHPAGLLSVSPFLSQDQPQSTLAARIKTDAVTNYAASTSVNLDAQRQIAVSLEFTDLRAGKSYRGKLSLTAQELVQQWELNVISSPKGVLGVSAVGPVKLISWPSLCGRHEVGSFEFSLYDKSGGGPYHNVHARLDVAGSSSKVLASNFTFDKLAFQSGKDTPVDLAAHFSPQVPLNLEGQQTFGVTVKDLSPGEYTGTLVFEADDSAADAADSKLALTIHVRHHWLIPILVILLGSIIGWFSSKYVVGKRKGHDLAQRVRFLRDRMNEVVCRIDQVGGWEFPSEASSLGFARLRVALDQLSILAPSAVAMLMREDEIQRILREAELRLKGLEALKSARRCAQQDADCRPAAQRAIGALLREATTILDGSSFSDAEQAGLTKVLEAVSAWHGGDTFIAKYKRALIDRWKSDECPDLDDIRTLEAGSSSRSRLETLLNDFGNQTLEQAVDAATDAVHLLKYYDEPIARFALLWRERGQEWTEELVKAEIANQPLDALFRLVDTGFWKKLESAAQANELTVELNLDRGEPNSCEVTEICLALKPSAKFKPRRILNHPLRVSWTVAPTSRRSKVIETDGLELVECFRSATEVRIGAELRWEAARIPIGTTVTFRVQTNPEYQKRRLFTQWTEYAPIGIAAAFATVTALGTLYDSTFGNLTQYLTMFVWAAGAGTGGNLFNQLGSTMAPGGRPDATLPGAAPPKP